MKASILTTLLAGLSTTAAYSPIIITDIETSQPNGSPDGQTDFYHFSFNVNSTNDPSQTSAYCWASWSDNDRICGENSGVYCASPYAEYAPVGEWVKCAHNESNEFDFTSGFAFQLYAPFGIGNFSLAVQQVIVTSDVLTLETSPYLITNTTTGDLTCQIQGDYAPGVTHASGTCNQNASPISLPIFESTNDTTPTTTCNTAGCPLPSSPTFSPAPTPSAPGSTCGGSGDVFLSFPVTETTAYGDNVFVVGNISALGNWNVYNADALNADSYTTSNPLWTGGNRGVPDGAGVAFEYKYIQWNADGTLLWECGENRVFTIPEDACDSVVVGNNPDYFRCGNH